MAKINLMQEENYIISVCMATYNSMLYIRQQIESILIQLRDCDELIISDDGSTDSTVKWLKSLGDSRIKIYDNRLLTSQPHKISGASYRSRKIASNFQNAIQKATGDYILLSDQDDIWERQKIEKFVKALQQHDMVYSDCSIINESGDFIRKTLFVDRKSKNHTWLDALAKNPFIGCSMGIRKSFIIKTIPFPKNIPMHDIWIGMFCKTFGKVVYLNEPLTQHRLHSSNASQAGKKSDQLFFIKIAQRLSVLYYLLMFKIDKHVKFNIFC